MEEARDILDNSIDELDLTQHYAHQQQRRAYLVTVKMTSKSFQLEKALPAL